MSEVLFSDARDYLVLEYQLRKSRRAGYSMRAFARDLKFSPSSLNDFLKGRVGMSEGRIHNLSAVLNWSEERSEYFKDLVYSKFAKDDLLRKTSKMRIKLLVKDAKSYYTPEQFSLLNQWYNFVMIEMFGLHDHISAKAISINLNVPIGDIQQAIKNLVKVGSIEMTDKGYKPTQNVRQAGDDKPSDAIKNLHHQILQQAQLALFKKSMSDRESHSLIFSIRDEDKNKMNTEIRKALYLIANKYAVDVVADSVQIVSFHSFQAYKMVEL